MLDCALEISPVTSYSGVKYSSMHCPALWLALLLSGYLMLLGDVCCESLVRNDGTSLSHDARTNSVSARQGVQVRGRCAAGKCDGL